MLRRRNRDLQINHERWLVSYADFITLLFAFFVVMYSISQVNEGKYRVLSTTLESAFKTLPRNIVNAEQTGKTPVLASSRQIIDMEGQGEVMDTSLIPLEQAFKETFGDLIDSGLMQVSSNELWLQIELRDSILFPSGSAEASNQAREIFSEVSDLLQGLDHPVQIEGFTDNIPISNERYPSNWELSAARASAIVKWMVNEGVAPSRLSAVGYGEHQPVASNSTAEGRAQNRRVAIMIARHKMDRPVSTPATADEPVPPAEGTPAEPSSAIGASSDSPETDEPIQAIELEDGDLLFTSDPDLPRAER